MRRNYDLTAVRRLVAEIKELSPRTTLNTHALFNFPTERREEFLSTIEFTACFDETLFFNYCETSGTDAMLITPQVDAVEREFRIRTVMRLLEEGRKGTLMQGTIG